MKKNLKRWILNQPKARAQDSYRVVFNGSSDFWRSTPAIFRVAAEVGDYSIKTLVTGPLIDQLTHEINQGRINEID